MVALKICVTISPGYLGLCIRLYIQLIGNH